MVAYSWWKETLVAPGKQGRLSMFHVLSPFVYIWLMQRSVFHRADGDFGVVWSSWGEWSSHDHKVPGWIPALPIVHVEVSLSKALNPQFLHCSPLLLNTWGWVNSEKNLPSGSIQVSLSFCLSCIKQPMEDGHRHALNSWQTLQFTVCFSHIYRQGWSSNLHTFNTAQRGRHVPTKPAEPAAAENSTKSNMWEQLPTAKMGLHSRIYSRWRCGSKLTVPTTVTVHAAAKVTSELGGVGGGATPQQRRRGSARRYQLHESGSPELTCGVLMHQRNVCQIQQDNLLNKQ